MREKTKNDIKNDGFLIEEMTTTGGWKILYRDLVSLSKPDITRAKIDELPLIQAKAQAAQSIIDKVNGYIEERDALLQESEE